MNNTTCATIVLVLLWLYLCLQVLGFLLTLIGYYSYPELLQFYSVLYSTHSVLPSSTAISTVLLGICLWQCQKAGYLVSPMTWYHRVLLALLVLLQVVAVVLEYLSLRGLNMLSFGKDWTCPIYGIVAVLLCILGGTLYCGWKCNLFCRPCCKGQYICYGSVIVVVLVLLVLLAVTASLVGIYGGRVGLTITHDGTGNTEILTIGYLGCMVIPVTQIYATALIWNTILSLPYTVPEVMTLVSSALAVACILALALGSILSSAMSGTTYQDGVESRVSKYYPVLLRTIGCPLLAIHLVSLGITFYLLEYKAMFYWPKQYICFGVFAAVLVASLITVVIANSSDKNDEDNAVKYTLLGYSIVLMVPTLWYAYRCGLLTWKWNSCIPKKRGLNGTDTAENTIPDSDIAKE